MTKWYMNDLLKWINNGCNEKEIIEGNDFKL
jgi:hypothetical protein